MDTLTLLLQELKTLLTESGVQGNFKGYDVFPFNFVSEQDVIGLRLFNLNYDKYKKTSDFDGGIGKIFLVQNHGLEAANLVGAALGQQVIEAVLQLQDCVPGVKLIDKPIAEINLLQNEKIAAAIRSILTSRAQANPTFPVTPDVNSSSWLCRVLVSFHLQVNF